MEVGISTACFYPLNTEKTIPIISKLGVNICEVFFEADCEYNKPFLTKLKNECDKSNVNVSSVHGFCATFEQQLFSDYKRRRVDALKTYKKVLKAASFLNANSYTFHGDKRLASLKDADIPHYINCFKELLEIAEFYGIYLAWENVSWCQGSRPEFIEIIREKIDSPYLKFTFDIKQAYRANVSIDEYLKVMNKDIVNVHINDNDENNDCLLPGNGTVDYTQFLDKLTALGYNGNLIVEIYKNNFKNMEEFDNSIQKFRKNIST